MPPLKIHPKFTKRIRKGITLYKQNYLRIRYLFFKTELPSTARTAEAATVVKIVDLSSG